MYVVYRDTANQWRWRYTTNGRVIAVSSESYFNKSDCLRGVAIMQASGNDPIYDM